MKNLFYWSLVVEVDDPECQEIEPGVHMTDWYPSLRACKQDVPNVIRMFLHPTEKIIKIEARHRLFGKRDLINR